MKKKKENKEELSRSSAAAAGQWARFSHIAPFSFWPPVIVCVMSSAAAAVNS